MRSPRDTAFRAAFLYAVLASLWILFSDALLSMFAPEFWARASTLKGLVFVAVTAIALFVIVFRSTTKVAEEAQRAMSTERVLSQVINTVPVGVMLVSADDEVTYLNPGAESLLRLSGPEAVGLRLAKLVSDDDPRAVSAIQGLLATGAADGLRLAARQGEPARAVIARAAAVEPGAPESGWVVALSDVSEVHEEARRSTRLVQWYRYLSESLLACDRAVDARSLLQRVSELAVETGLFRAAWSVIRDDQTGAVTGAASVGLETGGQDVAALLISRFADDPSGRFVGRLAEQQLIVANDIGRDPSNPWYAAASEGLCSSVTVGVYDADGLHAVLTLFSEEPGYFDDSGLEVIATLHNALSFTFERLAFNIKRLEAEAELSISEAGYRLLFRENPMPMWVYDVETFEFLAVNDAAVAKYGYTPDEFCSMTVLDIRPLDEHERFKRARTDNAEGFQDAGVWTHVDKSGRHFPVQVFAHSIEWEGHRARLVLPLEVATVL